MKWHSLEDIVSQMSTVDWLVLGFVVLPVVIDITMRSVADMVEYWHKMLERVRRAPAKAARELDKEEFE